MKKQESGTKTLLLSVIMSAPGPIVVGLGLLMGRSSTQFADFVRRSAELIAIIVSYVVYTVNQKHATDAVQIKEKREYITNQIVGVAMCLSGTAMLVLTLFFKDTEKGNVIPGLIIAVLGVIANTLFWLKYAKLSKETSSMILSAQSRLYRAKSLVDTCVTITLVTVAVFPTSKAAYYLDIVGSAVVAVYMIWSGVHTFGKNNNGGTTDGN